MLSKVIVRRLPNLLTRNKYSVYSRSPANDLAKINIFVGKLQTEYNLKTAEVDVVREIIDNNSLDCIFSEGSIPHARHITEKTSRIS